MKAMGTRFNVLMANQVPLVQKPARRRAIFGFSGAGSLEMDGMVSFACMSAPMMGASMVMAEDVEFGDASSADYELEADECELIAEIVPYAFVNATRSRKGTASAARVSRGDFYAKHNGLSVIAPKRNPKEPVTVTCVLYNTVLGGVPTAADVLAAVDDMEKLFAAWTAPGRLADAAFDFMKTELTVADMTKIVDKVTTQKPIAPLPLPAAVPAPSAARDVVLAKVAEMEGMSAISAENVLEMRLLALGAIVEDAAKTLVGGKFEVLKNKVKAGDGDGTRAMLLEIKLLLQVIFQQRAVVVTASSIKFTFL